MKLNSLEKELSTNKNKMKREEKSLLYERVYNYKAKSDYGLTEPEIQDVLKDYPDCNT